MTLTIAISRVMFLPDWHQSQLTYGWHRIRMEKLSPIQEETVRRRGSRADYPFGEAGGRKTKMPALVCLKTAWRTGAENIKNKDYSLVLLVEENCDFYTDREGLVGNNKNRRSN